jgi:hypothetical protein
VSVPDSAKISIQPGKWLRTESAPNPARVLDERGVGAFSQRELVIASLLRCPDRTPRNGHQTVARPW